LGTHPQWKLDIITVHDKLTRLPLFHLVYFFAVMEGVERLTSHPCHPPPPCIRPWVALGEPSPGLTSITAAIRNTPKATKIPKVIGML